MHVGKNSARSYEIFTRVTLISRINNFLRADNHFDNDSDGIFFFLEPCFAFIQRACHVDICNFRSNVSEVVQVVSRSFAMFASRLSRSPPDSGSSYDVLNLADAADVLVANSIPRSIASEANLNANKVPAKERIFFTLFIFS